MLELVGGYKASVGQDDIGLNHVVDGQTVLSGEISVAPT